MESNLKCYEMGNCWIGELSALMVLSGVLPREKPEIFVRNKRGLSLLRVKRKFSLVFILFSFL